MKKLIYVADDQEDIRTLVTMFLESDGYDVVAFATGDELYKEFINKPCDLMILDIMMPGTDGLTICNRVRQKSTVPIILLTAKDTDSDYIAGISLGSDDYLTKPFRPTLLNIKVKALLRRVDMERDRKEGQMSILKFADLSYNKKNKEICCRDKELQLTLTESSCLAVLMERGGEAVSRVELLEQVWGIQCEVETRVTDETIRRIRKKLAIAESSTSIQNKWGYGYKLMEDCIR